ncbi:hypothetical protein FJY84_04605 [Candidatus Bathyarchaeota archaeon]|nr:hypothetical protein [Candidatus Bathyarchaeota archaeon]
MGKCEVCGKNAFFQSTYRCLICNTEACEACLMPLVKIFGDMKETLITRKRWPYRGEIASVCSEKCYQKFKNIITEEIDKTPDFKPSNDKIAKIIEGNKILKPLFQKTWENYEASFIGSSHEVVNHLDGKVSIPKYNIKPHELDDEKINRQYNKSHKLENIDKHGSSLRLLIELIDYSNQKNV